MKNVECGIRNKEMQSRKSGQYNKKKRKDTGMGRERIL